MVEINVLRQFPIEESFMNDKKIYDIIYGYFQYHSLYDKENGYRYCWKSDCSAAQILRYYKENKEKGNPDLDLSDRRLRDKIKYFLALEYITQAEKDRKKIYILRELENGKYVFIKNSTLHYLIDTANRNVIKVYAYLKYKYQLNKKYGYVEDFRFSYASLLKILGFAESAQTNQEYIEYIKNILNCLLISDLIKIERVWVQTDSKIVTSYYALKEVNDDFKKAKCIKYSKKDNGYSQYYLS